MKLHNDSYTGLPNDSYTGVQLQTVAQDASEDHLFRSSGRELKGVRCLGKAWRIPVFLLIILIPAVLQVFWLLEPKKLIIACVGDSITRGDGAIPEKSYPSQLQQLLGSCCRVLNFGRDARTVTKAGDYPYWTTPNFRAAKSAHADIVVVMFGSNDAKPFNWNLESYKNDYGSMIEQLTLHEDDENGPQVFLMIPPPVFNTSGFRINKTTVNSVLPQTVRGVASVLGLPEPIDLFTAIGRACPDFEAQCNVSFDNIHLNANGYKIAADTVHDYLLHSKVNSSLTVS